MAFAEVLVRRTKVDGIQIGTIVGARGKSAKVLSVRWQDGREERVRLDAATDRIAAEGSLSLEWLIEPARLFEQFKQDADGVFVNLIKDGRGATLSTQEIKRWLTDLGLAESALEKAWNSSRPKVKRHRHIVSKRASYAWTDTPRDPYEDLRALSAAQAFDRLIKGRVPADEKPILIEVVRSGFSGTSVPSRKAAPPTARDEAVRAAELRAIQDQKARARGVQAFANLAMEVEELAMNGAEADILIARVRRSASAQDLSPIESAGRSTSFDRRIHSPIVGSPKDGARVTVVRPGYSWHSAKEDVLVAKALIIEQ